MSDSMKGVVFIRLASLSTAGPSALPFFLMGDI